MLAKFKKEDRFYVVTLMLLFFPSFSLDIEVGASCS